MDCQQMKKLLLFYGTLLLMSVGGWERNNKNQLDQFYRTRRWNEAQSPTSGYDELHKKAEGVAVIETSLDENPENKGDIDYDDYTDENTAAVGSVAVSGISPEDALQKTGGYSIDYDNYEDEIPDEVKGFAVIEPSFEDSIQHAKDEDAEYDNYDDETTEESKGGETFLVQETSREKVEEEVTSVTQRPDDGYVVLFVNTTPKNWTGCTTSSLDGIYVICDGHEFKITFPADLLSEVKVLGPKNMAAHQAPKHCDYRLDHIKNTLSIPFNGCMVKEEEEHIYNLQLSISMSNKSEDFDAYCVESSKFESGRLLRTSARGQQCKKTTAAEAATTPSKLPKCVHQTTPPASLSTLVLPFPKARESLHQSAGPSAVNPKTNTQRSNVPTPPQNPQGCKVNTKERIPCGQHGISPSNCKRRGCCMDVSEHICFYPLDECTADRHFVFAIRRNSVSVPVDPRNIFIPGKPLCTPAIVNEEVAIFKINFKDCGAISYEVGETKVYLIEVHAIVHPVTLKYGMITRSDPLSFLIECHYSDVDIAQQSVVSIDYMVQSATPNVRSSSISKGVDDVKLKIATDHSYSSYYPTYHQPLHHLLGHPVFLELSLSSPHDPDAVILVHYCLAYPNSVAKAMIFVYDRCADPNDPSMSVLETHGSPNRHRKRFRVNAFQHMPQLRSRYRHEEIHFACSTEVCNPHQRPCEEWCSD